MGGNSSKQLLFSLILLIIGMVLLSFAAVPIYNIFCKATGYGGTVKESATGSTKKGIRKITVKFDANVAPDLLWQFKPLQNQVVITSGENNLVFYQAKNLTSKNIIGTAVYNVTPANAGQYFNKIHCFCFEEQLLRAHQKVDMPVAFFIDAAFDDDPEMQDIDTITLSYSFFKVREID